MKTSKTLSEIQNRIDELKNKIHQAEQQSPTEVHTHNGVNMFGVTINLEDVWSEDEMNEFVHLMELKKMLEDLEISK